ncbi:hypothetical protein BDZ89DRAFT_1187320 [Hymenopellis radicata]|nr:hypothetical protein BDZ89DRAFT_1187320 [Hymenopellis radicata]
MKQPIRRLPAFIEDKQEGISIPRLSPFDIRDSLSEETRQTMAGSWAPSTTKQHKASWQSFATWCEERGIGQDRRLPAAETTLCDYASSWKGRKGSASLPSKMAGIKAVHIVNGVAWNGGQSLKRVMEGVKRLKPVEAARETRAPVTLERMEVLNSHLDPKDGKDACVAAIANIAFFGQCRLGELLPESPDPEKLRPNTVPSFNNLGDPISSFGSRTLRLPFTKTKKQEGEDVTICAQKGVADPIKAIDHHAIMNDLDQNGGEVPLASFIDEDGDRKLLSKKSFILRCNEIWMAKGMKRITGHSFRIGGTTHYLLKGIKPDVVKALGRWSSDSFLRYWRQLDILGVMYVERI